MYGRALYENANRFERAPTELINQSVFAYRAEIEIVSRLRIPLVRPTYQNVEIAQLDDDEEDDNNVKSSSSSFARRKIYFNRRPQIIRGN